MSENVTIKDNLQTVSNTIAVIQREVAQQNKELQHMKQQLAILQYKVQDPFREIKQYFDLAKYSINQNFEKQCTIFDQEVDFLKQQIDTVTEDKLKIIQIGFKVDKQLRQLSQDIGIQTEELFGF